MEEKRPFFVQSCDGDIRKLVGMLFEKNAKYFGQLQKFRLHHNLSSFDLITVEI